MDLEKMNINNEFPGLGNRSLQIQIILIPLSFIAINQLIGFGTIFFCDSNFFFGIMILDFEFIRQGNYSRYLADQWLFAIVGIFIVSALIIELINQSKGSWPTIFWTDLLLISVILAFKMSRKMLELIESELLYFGFLVAANTDIALRLIDPYQAFSNLDYLRFLLWSGVMMFSLYKGIIWGVGQYFSLIVGTLLGFAIYSGMVLEEFV